MRRLLVQKFGGTSVGTIDRIKHVARWALDCQAKGDDIVIDYGSRAALDAESRVWALVMKAATPPGCRPASDLMMKWLCIVWRPVLWIGSNNVTSANGTLPIAASQDSVRTRVSA